MYTYICAHAHTHKYMLHMRTVEKKLSSQCTKVRDLRKEGQYRTKNNTVLNCQKHFRGLKCRNTCLTTSEFGQVPE